MDHITHDEFAGRLEKIMEPLISRPSFKAKIAFFLGNVSSYNPYGTDRLHGAPPQWILPLALSQAAVSWSVSA